MFCSPAECNCDFATAAGPLSPKICTTGCRTSIMWVLGVAAMTSFSSTDGPMDFNSTASQKLLDGHSQSRAAQQNHPQPMKSWTVHRRFLFLLRDDVTLEHSKSGI